jgi:hypothetical protein
MSSEPQSEKDFLKPDLNQIVSAFGMQALMACGKIMNPITKKYETDLAMAQYHIGVLEVLQSKTAGNATDEERQLMDDILHQSRMAFLDASQGRGKIETE